MGQFSAFRLTGRTRGVENHRGVVLVPVGQVLGGWGGRKRRTESAGTDGDHLGLALLRTGPCLVGEGVPGEQEPGTRVAEVVGDLAGLEQGVHRDDDAAGPQYAEVGEGELGHVGQHDRNSVAGLHATVLEQPGHAGGGLPRGERGDIGAGDEPVGCSVAPPQQRYTQACMECAAVAVTDRRCAGPAAPGAALLAGRPCVKCVLEKWQREPDGPTHHLPGGVSDKLLRGAGPTDHRPLAVDHRNRRVGYLSRAQRLCDAVSENIAQLGSPLGRFRRTA